MAAEFCKRLCCIAELYSAGGRQLADQSRFRRPADCKSAIQQIANLRYVTAGGRTTLRRFDASTAY